MLATCTLLIVMLFAAILLANCQAQYTTPCRQGMIARRQIRTDPNHTRYASNIADDINVVLEYGDEQF